MAATTTTPAPAGLPLTRCRRAALRFGVPVCLALVAVTGLSLVANFGQGSFPVRYTAPAAARSLTVDVAGGRLALEGTATGPATVTGTGRYSIVRSTVTEQAGASGAGFGYQCHFSFGACQLDATVSAPADLPVAASTGGGTATVGGTAGPVTVFTGGGDLLAQLVSGPLSSGGGNIIIREQ
jgi:hypothetical protein